jgi:predicted transcriptional regulator
MQRNLPQFSEAWIFTMFDWHKAYESQDLKDIVTLFLDSGLRRECGLKIVETLLEKPNSRRGAVVELMAKSGYAKATVERTLHDLETIGLISSEGKYLKTGRYRVNLSRFSSALSRLSRTVKKVEQDMGEKSEKEGVPEQTQLNEVYEEKSSKDV